MTSVVFENATIQDVIGKAVKIAPTRGSKFEKAAGILITIDADKRTVSVQATDTEVFYTEFVDFVDIEGPSTKWLIPSQVLGGVCSGLQIGSGKQITWTSEDGRILNMASNKLRVKLNMMQTHHYPEWDSFDPDELEMVTGFGDLVTLVMWAAAKDSDPPMSGVHFNGDFVVATDRYRLVRVPLDSDAIYKPITVPVNSFVPLGKILHDARVGVIDGHLCMMPDDSTQIKTVIYGGDYVSYERVFDFEHSNSLEIKRTPLIEMMNRAMVMTGAERVPTLRMYIGQEEVACFMEQQELGMLGDVIDVPGQAAHKRIKLKFTPKNIIEALSNAPSEKVTIHYNTDLTKTKPVKIDGGSGYIAMVMPMVEENN